jgi:Zn-dependent peptidase ImmA (M78 family)/transcriptional regulator with XRE-family HTH domain
MEELNRQLPYTGVFSHDKLRLARCAAGRSLAEIGEILGVTRQYAHKLEVNGIPSTQQLVTLSEALGVSSDFFYSPRRSCIELEQCHFRSVRASTLTIKKSIAAQVELFELLIDELDKEISFPPVAFQMIEEPLTSIDRVEQIAEQFRRDQGLGLGPISSVSRLAEKVGVLVVSVVDADDRVDAFSLHNKRPLIVRNTAKMNPCRQRFDVAHELGHLIMHQGMETGCHDTENQANAFASALLMPRSSFAGEFPAMRGQYLNWSALSELKLRWKVSFKALIYRAQTLHLISPEQAKSGFTYLNRNGFTKHESLDEKIQMEQPILVQRAIDLLDYGTWRTALRSAGLTSETVAKRYLLKGPSAPLLLVS